MSSLKNLTFASISTLFAGVALPAHGQIALEVSSEKTYRQTKKGMKFQKGEFKVGLSDGAVVTVSGCDSIRYYKPRDFSYFCNLGTSGYLESGFVTGVTPPNRYLSVAGIRDALNVEPNVPQLARLNAAPASTLRRPKAGFKDSSAVISYNLHVPPISKYTITRYSTSTFYNSKQRAKFESDIVPGTYQYYFPKLGQPTVPIAILPQIYPMPEGAAKGLVNSKGLRFTTVNQNKWSKDGFMELSYSKPNLFKWTPFATQALFPGADTLSFAIRVIKDQDDPKSIVAEQDNYSNRQQSVFPDFSSDQDAKISLRNPTSSSFTTPPLLAGGTKGVVELRLDRLLQTSGVTYDRSYRKFQVPVVVVNKYSDYKSTAFPAGKKNTSILDDTDGDGFNNLNEWLQDSAANISADKPIAPVPIFNEGKYVYDLATFDFFGGISLYEAPYFGFTVDQKLGTEPEVLYTLQRSVDGGSTYQEFPDGYHYSDGSYSATPPTAVNDLLTLNWIVTTKDFKAGEGLVKPNAPARRQIRVESLSFTRSDRDVVNVPLGTEKDLYRLKITLKK
jgi:hypothetical protein